MGAAANGCRVCPAHLRRTVLIALLTLVLAVGSVRAQGVPVPSSRDIFHPVYGRHGMVSTQEATATRIGLEILKQGGNAVDAAVAVGFALAVTLPRAGNLGGGGFMLVHDAASGRTVAIDYRETAPAAAHRDMYLDEKGEVDTRRARTGYTSIAVPGTVAGLVLALERYGTMPLREVVAPAIRLARDGFVVTRAFRDSFTPRRRDKLMRWPESRRIFLKPDGALYEVGERFVQTDLARSLTEIAEHGAAAFYEGAIAKRIVADMEANGGLITGEDLAAYRPVVREPVRGTYRGYEIVSMPPPSSGGIHLIQILNILEGYDLAAFGHNSARTLHYMAEAMKLAFADRSKYLGDPDFWRVPVKGLTSKAYAARLRAAIDPGVARRADEIAPGNPESYESRETTHFSVVDRWGNAVSNTYTINLGYGSGIVAEGTGILLNNEMDDFSAKPGTPNVFGLIGGEANAIAPGKRPLSSMTPTIVFKDGEPFLVTGSPGGSRIITTVVQLVVNVIDYRMNVAAATAAPRIHHQWRPDRLRYERGISPDTLELLAGRGHILRPSAAMGATQSILRLSDGTLTGASDPRRPGALTLGY